MTSSTGTSIPPSGHTTPSAVSIRNVSKTFSRGGRTVRALEDEGLIARTGHRVRLLDVDRLRQLSPLPPRQPAFEPAWLPAAR